MRTIKRGDLAVYGTPIYRQAVRRQLTADPTGRDLYVGERRPGLWQTGWRAALWAGAVLLLGATAWTLLFWAVWGLVGR